MEWDNKPSDLTLARAKQSIKKERTFLSGDDSDVSYSERLILTRNGEKTIYDAAAPCNRCGICAAVCPSYKATKKENMSPRGRCQLTRLLKEYRISSPEKALNEAIGSCLLCGACENICHASIPIPEIVMELRRHYLKRRTNLITRLGLRLLLDHPKIYSFWIKTCLILLNLRLSWLAKILGMPYLLAMSRERFDEMGFVPPVRSGLDILRPQYQNPPKHSVKWVYFASCATNYLMPQAAVDAVELIDRHEGEGMLAGNICCGFMSYRLGNLDQAREFAKRNIRIFEELRKKHGNKFVVITECSSCASFLKNYEQLFIQDRLEEDIIAESAETVHIVENREGKDSNAVNPSTQENPYSVNEDVSNKKDPENWRARAREFSDAVKDLSEILNVQDFAKIGKCAEEEGQTICFQQPCSISESLKKGRQVENLLEHLSGICFKEFEGNAECCGGDRGNSVVPEKVRHYSEYRKTKALASVQAEIVLSTDPCCIMAMRSCLKKWYPSAQAMHLCSYINRIEKKYRKGRTD